MAFLSSFLFQASLSRDVMGRVLPLEGQTASVGTRLPCVIVTSSSPHIQ